MASAHTASAVTAAVSGVRASAPAIRFSCRRGRPEPGPTPYQATMAAAAYAPARGSYRLRVRARVAMYTTAPAAKASGAISASVSSARATVSGAVTTTTTRSLARGPRTDRRTARLLWARSAARSRVITASETTRPATGRIRVSATAAIMRATPARVVRPGCEARAAWGAPGARGAPGACGFWGGGQAGLG